MHLSDRPQLLLQFMLMVETAAATKQSYTIRLTHKDPCHIIFKTGSVGKDHTSL